MKETKIFLLGVITSTVLYPILSELSSCIVNLAEIGMAKIAQKANLQGEPEEESRPLIGFAIDDNSEEEYEE